MRAAKFRGRVRPLMIEASRLVLVHRAKLSSWNNRRIELHSPWMRIELDHVFIWAARGAPEAEKLIEFGLREGSPNQHLGQGTANRRFNFANSMLELLWVSNEGDAQSNRTRPTLLWERWCGREGGASPFGICLRPADSHNTQPPFAAWKYRPEYLPDPLCLHIGGAGIEEPMWVFLSFMRRIHREQGFLEHPIGIREITGLTLTSPAPLRSDPSKIILETGILATRVGAFSLLEIEFDHNRRKTRADFRPHLPLVFRF